MTLTRVNTNGITDGTIVDADVSGSAAIAGTKVSPSFGSQNTTTTGTSTAASFIPTGSSVPANGVYLPGANALGLSTNSTERIRVTSGGLVGIGTTAPGFPLDIVSVGGESVRLRGTSGTDVSQLLFTSNTAGTNYGYLTSGSGYLGFGYGATERARIDSSGYLRMATSTGGIQFNGDTAAANALNDYEEGTFTPTIVGSTTAGTGTYTAQVGKYTKIGNRVLFSIQVTWTAHTGAGKMDISGLPFTSQSTAANTPPPAVNSSNLTTPANAYPTALVINNTTTVRMYSVVTGGGTIALLDLDTAATLYISGHYEAA